jgi:ribokinase
MAEARSGGQVLVAGSANVDFVVRAPRIPAPGETVLGGDLMIVPGGKGANQAIACARAGGAATAMLASLGNDMFGAMLEQSLRDAGVQVTVMRSSRSTGAALITVSDDAENAITVAPGANQMLAPGDLPDLADVSWLVMQLETPIPTVLAFASAARAAGVKVPLNAAPAQKLPAELLASIDVLVVNEAELAVIAGVEGSIAERLSKTGVACTVVTLGGRGCCAVRNGELLVHPVFVVEPVDTTAAGDTFTGVLGAALSRDRPMAEALRLAAAASALATTRAGAQSSIPDRDSVAQFLAKGVSGDREKVAAYCGVTVAAD